MGPTTKKWIATSFEISLIIAFAGFGFLASDEIKQWYKIGLTTHPPAIVWIWVVIGLLLGLARYLTARFGRQEALGVLSTSSFIEAYKETLERAINSLVTLLRSSEEEQKELLDTAETAVLQAIANVVDYFRNVTSTRKGNINCVLMEPRLYDSKVDDAVSVLGLEPNGRQRMKYLLRIVKMAREEIEIPIIHLPVYDLQSDFRDKNPFGAPRTFVTRQKQVINFTLWLLPHKGRSSWAVLRDLWIHFWRLRKRFLSFASLPVISGGSVVAVINIHCDSTKVLGRNPEMLTDFLIPFITILSYIYEQKKALEA
jgi:hypothetical protein